MPLPQYLMGQNQFDTAPLENALWKFAQHQEQQRQNAFRQQQMDMDRTRLGFEGERLGFERERQPLNMDMLRAQVEQARAAAQLTPLQRAHLQAQTGMTNAHADLFRAQAAAAQQRDDMDKLVLQSLGGGQQPSAAPAPNPVRPQSFAPPAAPAQTPIRPVADTAPRPPGDPMLIPTQAAQPAQPQQGQADPIVQTPMGPMPASRARILAFYMAYKGKGDAGRMLAESADPGKLPKTVVDDVAKEEIKNTDLMGRLAQIQRSFKPDFLSYENQAKQYGISWLDKFDATRSKLPPQELQTHAEYAAFRRDVTDNLNRYIKEITGAAMGVEEAKRIVSSMPNMNDGPTEFKAKLDSTVRSAQLALARQRYLRKEGLNGQPWQGTPEDAAREMPLEKMQGNIRRDTMNLLQQLKSQHPNANPEQINGAVRAIIRQKYGIDA